MQEWDLDPDERRIEYVGPFPDKNLRKAVWEPAHRLVADVLGLDYVDEQVDCVGVLDGYDISSWEIKTRHSGGHYLLRLEQHTELWGEIGGYLFCTLERESFREWRVLDVVPRHAWDVEEELGMWSPGPEERDYWTQNYS